MELWGNRLMDLVINNMLTQQIRGNTRDGGEDKPPILDLVFTRKPNDIQNVKCRCLLVNRDRMTSEMEVLVENVREGEIRRQYKYEYV